MRKVLFFLLFSVLISAQEPAFLEFKQSLKDKNARTKSLTVLDVREDKNIGIIERKNEQFEIKLANEDVTSLFSKKFAEDNKTLGSTDLVVLVENLKVSNQKDQQGKDYFFKTHIKLAGFIKRNDKYYFLNRFENSIITVNTPSFQKDIVKNVESVFSDFIKGLYGSPSFFEYIPEAELKNYESYLTNQNLSLGTLKDGVYTTYKTFYKQVPDPNYSVYKNSKGEIKRLKYKGENFNEREVYCFVDGGKMYKTLNVGFIETTKNDKNYTFLFSRYKIFGENANTGVLIGAMAGGLVGAAIGAALDSTPRAPQKLYGIPSKIETEVALDNLTGDYVFKD